MQWESCTSDIGQDGPDYWINIHWESLEKLSTLTRIIRLCETIWQGDTSEILQRCYETLQDDNPRENFHRFHSASMIWSSRSLVQQCWTLLNNALTQPIKHWLPPAATSWHDQQFCQTGKQLPFICESGAFSFTFLALSVSHLNTVGWISLSLVCYAGNGQKLF